MVNAWEEVVYVRASCFAGGNLLVVRRRLGSGQDSATGESLVLKKDGVRAEISVVMN